MRPRTSRFFVLACKSVRSGLQGGVIDPVEDLLESRAVRRVLSADWVLPVDGAPIEGGAVAVEDGADRRGRDAGGARRGRALPGRRDRAGLRQRAHPSRVRRLRRLRRRLLVRALARSPTSSARPRIDRAEMEAIARLGAAECLAPGSHGRRRSFSGAGATACAELGLRAIVYLEVFGADPEEARGGSRRSTSARRRAARSACGPASRRTPRTPARPRSTPPAWRSACRSRRT